MKKKILGIVVSILSMAIVFALVAFGTLQYIKNKNVEETINVLDVSWYNETDKEFTITTAEQLYEFAELSDFYSFKNQTVYLGADIVINDGNAEDWDKEAPEKLWTPIKGFAGTFDGQGHSISGIYAKGYESPMALFINTEYTCTIKNFSLVNSLFKTNGNGGSASFLSNGGGKLSKLYSDAIFVHKGERVGGIASNINKQTTIEECWFDGLIDVTSRNVGGFVDVVSNGARLTIKHCLFSGEINQKYEFNGTRTAGVIGRVADASTVIINDTLSSGIINTAKQSEIGSMIGKSESGVSITIADSYTSKSTHSTVVGSKSGSYSGVGIGIYGQYLLGTKAYQWTSLDFDKYWIAVENDTPILKCFANDMTTLSLDGITKEYDTSWYNEYTSKFVLTTRQQMYGFYYLSMSNTFAGQTVSLGNDIIINEGKATDWEKTTPEYLWYPINQFAGTFDGQGYTISGICLKEDGAYQGYNGLFGRADQGSVIKNFLLKNSYFERMFDELKQASFLGSVAGETRGTIDSVYSDAILKSNGIQVGGIVGRMNYMDSNYEMTVTVNNCWFDGEITGIMNQKMGGIVSYVGRGSKILKEGTKLAITHCLNTGTINNDRRSNKEGFNGAAYIGGILGFDNSAVNLIIEDCLNAGVLNLGYKGYAGSITGRIAKSGSIYTMNDTYTTWESLSYNSDIPLAIHDISGTLIGGPANLPAELLIGENAYRYSTLDFKNYWSLVDNSTPVLKSFAGKVGVKTQSTASVSKKVDKSWYNPDKNEYVLDSVEDLYGFYVISTYEDFSGKTIKLGKDIIFNAGNAVDWATNAPSNEWFPVGVNRANYRFSGTFDGQGHTISGIYLSDNSDLLNYSGFFGVIGTEGVVKNLKITNSYFERLNKSGQSAMLGSVAGEVQGTIQNVYSNAILYTDGNQAGGIVARMVYADKEKKTTTLVDNCWFDGILTGTKNQKMGGITAYAGRSGVQAEDTKLKISNCLFTGTVGNDRTSKADELGGQYIGGIFGYDISAVNMMIDNCLSAGTIDTVYDGYVGSVIGMINKSGSVFTVTNTYGTDECWNVKGTPKGIHVNNGTIVGGVATIPESMITDVKAYQYTSLDFTNTWAAVENDTPELKWISGSGKSVSGYEQLVDVSWYDKDKDTYVLTDAKDFYGFREVSTYTNFEGKTVKLGGNITVNSETLDGNTVPVYSEWVPIGQRYLFAGTFDGQGCTISGIYSKRDTGYMGLFSTIPVGITIKNFYLKNSYFESTSTDTDVSRIGSIVGDLRGNLEGVYSNAIVVSNGANQVGGLVGIANYQDLTHETTVNIKNCWFDGKVIGLGTAYQLGGIAGSIGRGSGDFTASKSIINFTNCLMSGDIINEGTGTYQYTGGIFGDSNKANLRVNITECLVAGTITTIKHEGVGSVFGALRHSSSVCTLTDTYAANESYEGNLLADQNITNQTSGNITKNNSGFAAKEDLRSRGAYFVTSLDFENNWSARNTDVPAPKCFVGGVLVADGDVFALDKEYTEWYDKNPDANVFELTTLEHLYGFAYLSKSNTFAGKTITLGANIKMNEGKASNWANTAPEYKWYPIGSNVTTAAGTGAFEGIFDGKGHSISGLYIKNTSGENNTGFFRNTQGGSVVKNFLLLNSYVESNGGRNGSVVGDMRGTLSNVYSEAIVTGESGAQTGGLVGIFNVQTGQGITEGIIENCWFDGIVDISGTKAQQIGGIAGAILKGGSSTGIFNINNCLVTGKIKSSSTLDSDPAYVGGIWGDNSNGSKQKVYITNCLMAGTIEVSGNTTAVGSLGGAFRNEGSDCYIKNVNVISSSAGVINPEIIVARAIQDPDGSGKKKDGKLYYQNYANVESTETAPVGSIFVAETDMNGYNAYFNTYVLDNTDAWVARQSTHPIPSCFVNKIGEIDTVVKVDTSFMEDGTYTIDNLSELYGFAYLAHKSAEKGAIYKDKIIKLGANITVNELAEGEKVEDWETKAPINQWYPIGSNASNAAGAGAFAGTFDGQGYTINGIYIKNTENVYNTGFFRNTQGGSIVKDFQLVNSYIESAGSRNGSIAGDLRGTLSGVYSNAIVTGETKAQTGGLVGAFNVQTGNGVTTGTIEKCWFDGTVDISGANAQQIGGITGAIVKGGSANGTFYFKDCLVTGAIKSSTTKADDPAYVGGLFGDNSGGSKQYVYVTNCMMAGTIEVTGNTAGVASLGGAFRNTGSFCYFENTYAITGGNPQVTVARGIVDPGDGSTKNEGKLYYQKYAGVESTEITPKDSIFCNKADISGYNVFFETTFLDSASNWSARKTDVPVPTCFVSSDAQTKVVDRDEVVRIDTTWDKDSTGAYIIRTLDEFYGFTYSYKNKTVPCYVDGTQQTVAIKLGADITLNDGTPAGADGIKDNEDDWSNIAPVNKWYPIGNSNVRFKGTFNGDGHTISGVYVKENGLCLGLFGATNIESSVENLILTNSYIEGTGTSNYRVGSIVGDLRGNLTSVYSDAIVKIEGSQGGGLVGAANFQSGANRIVISDCWFDGELIGASNTSSRLGGIAGVVARGGGTAYIDIKNCLVTGTITRKGSLPSGLTYLSVGGFVGDNNAGNVKLLISGSLMAGSIEVDNESAVGAFVGAIYHNSATLKFENSQAINGNITVLNGSRSDKNNNVTPTNTNSGFSNALSGSLTNEQLIKLFGSNAADYWTADTITNGVPILITFKNFWTVLNTPKSSD